MTNINPNIQNNNISSANNNHLSSTVSNQKIKKIDDSHGRAVLVALGIITPVVWLVLLNARFDLTGKIKNSAILKQLTDEFKAIPQQLKSIKWKQEFAALSNEISAVWKSVTGKIAAFVKAHKFEIDAALITVGTALTFSVSCAFLTLACEPNNA